MLVVVSAIYGMKDVARPIHSDADRCVLFTESDDVGADGWEVHRVTFKGLRPREQSKYVKTMALELFPDADTVIWIDGNIRVMGSLRELERYDLAAFAHPFRSCLYDEAEECRRLGLAKSSDLDRQVEAYRRVKHPKHWGLWECGVLVRRNTLENQELGRLWSDHIETFTSRDQISFPFVLREMGLRCARMPNLRTDESRFRLEDHLKARD